MCSGSFMAFFGISRVPVLRTFFWASFGVLLAAITISLTYSRAPINLYISTWWTRINVPKHTITCICKYNVSINCRYTCHIVHGINSRIMDTWGDLGAYTDFCIWRQVYTATHEVTQQKSISFPRSCKRSTASLGKWVWRNEWILWWVQTCSTWESARSCRQKRLPAVLIASSRNR